MGWFLRKTAVTLTSCYLKPSLPHITAIWEMDNIGLKVCLKNINFTTDTLEAGY